MRQRILINTRKKKSAKSMQVGVYICPRLQGFHISQILLSHFVFVFISLSQALHTWLLTECEIKRSNNIIYKSGVRDEGLFGAMQTVHTAN